jgi:hypothetical protein
LGTTTTAEELRRKSRGGMLDKRNGIREKERAHGR